jgi:hypothetical protein
MLWNVGPPRAKLYDIGSKGVAFETDTAKVTPVSIAACIVVAWALFQGRFGSVAIPWAGRFVPSALVARACAIAVVPVFAAQIALLVYQAQVENGPPLSDWLRQLPIPVYDHHTERASVHTAIAYGGYALATLETVLVALVAFAVHAGRVRFSYRFAGSLFAALAIVSVAAPAMATTDPYEYVASGMIGFRSYAPGPNPFVGTIYAPIDVNVPMRGVIYGPLWLAIDTAVTSLGSTILAKVIALRAFNVLLLGALIWLLARARVAPAGLTALALNPAIWFYVVVNPHADIEGLVAVAGAFALAKREKGLFAMLLVVVAGMIKVPFVVAGAAAFAPLDVKRRIALAAGAAVLVFGISYVFPGPGYLLGVAGHVHVWAGRAHERGADSFVYAIPFVAAIMVAFVFFRRGVPGAAWLFGQLSPLAAPWYLFWGMPYAFASQTFVLYLIALPLFVAMRDFMYIGPPVPFAVDTAVLCAFVLDVYLVARRHVVKVPAY